MPELLINCLKNDFVVGLIEEKEYSASVFKFVKDLSAKYKKICYVLLQTPCEDIKREFKKNDLSLSTFFFIDILSDHYKDIEEKAKNCTYIKGANIPNLLFAIADAIKKHKCEIVLFDNISSLLSYHQNNDIEHLTNTLRYEPAYGKTKKIYFVRKNDAYIKDEITNLISDLTLFVDKVVEI
jgi:archaellum biogenesis ATPase FlaH